MAGLDRSRRLTNPSADSLMLHLAILANAANYHLRRWLPALASREIRVSLMSFVEPIADLPDVDFHLIERPTSKFARHSLVDFVLAARQVRSMLNKLHPDVLLGSYATNYGYLAARTGMHPFVLQTWTADVQLYPNEGLKRFVLAPMVRHALRTADLVTTDGPALRDVVLESFPFCTGKTESVLWGIELENFIGLAARRPQARAELGIPDDAIVITCARGIRFHDRPEISLPALFQVLEANANTFAVVLTLGHPVDNLTAGHLERMRSHKRCLVIDRFLGPAEIEAQWAASDFVVSVPLFDGISETLLEAMASGCIPIVSDIPPNRIIIPDPGNAIFSRADSAATLANDIQRGLGEVGRLKESAVPANQRWVKENASIDRAADLLSDLLNGLVHKNNR